MNSIICRREILSFPEDKNLLSISRRLAADLLDSSRWCVRCVCQVHGVLPQGWRQVCLAWGMFGMGYVCHGVCLALVLQGFQEWNFLPLQNRNISQNLFTLWFFDKSVFALTSLRSLQSDWSKKSQCENFGCYKLALYTRVPTSGPPSLNMCISFSL